MLGFDRFRVYVLPTSAGLPALLRRCLAAYQAAAASRDGDMDDMIVQVTSAVAALWGGPGDQGCRVDGSLCTSKVCTRMRVTCACNMHKCPPVPHDGMSSTSQAESSKIQTSTRGYGEPQSVRQMTMGVPHAGGPVPDRIAGRCRARAVAAAPFSGCDCSRGRADGLAALANSALCSALAEAAKAMLGWRARRCSCAC